MFMQVLWNGTKITRELQLRWNIGDYTQVQCLVCCISGLSSKKLIGFKRLLVAHFSRHAAITIGICNGQCVHKKRVIHQMIMGGNVFTLPQLGPSVWGFSDLGISTMLLLEMQLLSSVGTG